MITSSSRLEERVGALISAYADRAPVDVDPMGMTRLAASRSRRDAGSRLFMRTHQAIAFVVLVLAIASAIVAGALVAGSNPFRRDLDRLLEGRQLVEPFVGLPPEGAPPSSPETGELVLAFDARILALGMDVHSMRVYSDGRLIWHRNLEATPLVDQAAFGSSPPTTGLIQQRLSPDGVEALRSEVLRTATVLGPARGSDYTTLHPPGGAGVWWGGLAVRLDGQLVSVTWSDRELPGRLADPGSWLAPEAWADRRIGAFVPARYAVCLWHEPSEDFASTAVRLPASVKTQLQRAPLILGPTSSPPGCYAATTDVIREVVRSLGTARAEGSETLTFRVPDATGSGETVVQIEPVLPNGDVACTNCG